MIQTLLFGLVQGLTEFLPVSSSGHLFFIQKILSVNGRLLPVFVLLHCATLCSVLVFFFKDIISALKKRKIVIIVALATLFTLGLAFILDLFGSSLFSNKYLICAGYLVTAALLFKVRKGGHRAIADLSLKESCFIGILQALAVIPGISRSGITITALMKRGLSKNEAFTFSFFLSIPVIICAFIYELKDFEPVFSGSALMFGFITAFISGLLALKMLKKYLDKEKLYCFGYYCILIAGLILFF